jgi:hypothetical protein
LSCLAKTGQQFTVARSLPRLHSLLVLVCDEFVEEHYFHGWSPERPANLKSASKSILSILVGIAIDEGFLAGVEAPIASFFRLFNRIYG